jgi:hypothetical protein
LARELHESQEVFPFSDLEPASYELLKAHEESDPGYMTPLDERLERLKDEGMKVVLGKNPESGNIYILPAQSDNIEMDMIFPKHFKTDGVVNEKLRRLIEKSK